MWPVPGQSVLCTGGLPTDGVSTCEQRRSGLTRWHGRTTRGCRATMAAAAACPAARSESSNSSCKCTRCATASTASTSRSAALTVLKGVQGPQWKLGVELNSALKLASSIEHVVLSVLNAAFFKTVDMVRSANQPRRSSWDVCRDSLESCSCSWTCAEGCWGACTFERLMRSSAA